MHTASGYARRRLPGRVPSQARLTVVPDEPPVTKAQIVGRLVGVEGSNILEILHLDITGTMQVCEQQDLAKLVNHRVVVTVELSVLDGEDEQEGWRGR